MSTEKQNEAPPALSCGRLVGASAPEKLIPLHKRTGVPMNVEDWTEEDWLDLHRATQTAIRKIARRHRPNTTVSNTGANTKT